MSNGIEANDVLVASSSIVLLAVFAASSLVPASWREAELILIGILFAIVSSKGIFPLITRRKKSNAPRHRTNGDTSHTISTVPELRVVLPAGLSGEGFKGAKKVIDYLDDQMISFIARSPILHLATVDITGMPFISPKGDRPGFVQVRARTVAPRGHRLVIPDRPGNRLLFGLQNVLAHPKVALLMEIPGTCATLRIGGSVTLSTHPQYLQDTALFTRGHPPVLVMVVDVEYAFFHCNKAYLRSGIWKPETWGDKPQPVSIGAYFTKNPQVAKQIDDDMNYMFQKKLPNCENASEML